MLGSVTSKQNPVGAPAAPGVETGFCFEVLLSALAANDLQGKTASATWQFLSTSN